MCSEGMKEKRTNGLFTFWRWVYGKYHHTSYGDLCVNVITLAKK